MRKQLGICLTSDMSTNQTRYFVITGHFINQEWDLKAINVGTFCASEICDSPHITAEDLVSLIQKYLVDLEINAKISFFVTDGEARELKFVNVFTSI